MSVWCILMQRPCGTWVEERDEATITRLAERFALRPGVVCRAKDAGGDLLMVLIRWKEEDDVDAP